MIARMSKHLAWAFAFVGVVAVSSSVPAAVPNAPSTSSPASSAAQAPRPQPQVDPRQATTKVPMNCDLNTYFPEAPGSPAGGWTTGTCKSPKSACAIDEMFSTWEGPTVKVGATTLAHCRAGRAGAYRRTSTRSAATQFVPFEPPARGAISRLDGPYPYNACHEICIGDDANRVCKAYEYAYDYVICPWAPDNKADGKLAAYNTFEVHPGVVGYCNPGSNTPAAAPTAGTTYAAIYRYDPQCSTCFACSIQ